MNTFEEQITPSSFVTYVPSSKSSKTKPALTEARNILGKAINDWYLANVK